MGQLQEDSPPAARLAPDEPEPGPIDTAALTDNLASIRTIARLLTKSALTIGDAGTAAELSYLAERLHSHAAAGLAAIPRTRPVN